MKFYIVRYSVGIFIVCCLLFSCNSAQDKTSSVLPANIVVVDSSHVNILPQPLSPTDKNSPFYSGWVDSVGRKRAPFESIPDDALMAKMNVRDLIYYYVVYPNLYMQICTSYGLRISDKSNNKKYFYRHMETGSSGRRPSSQQDSAIRKNETAVRAFLKKNLNEKTFHTDFYSLILEINAIELIPLICETANFNDERVYGFTLLSRLMEKNNYMPFLRSQLYYKVFSPDAEDSFGTEVSEKEVQELKGWAMKFYLSRK